MTRYLRHLAVALWLALVPSIGQAQRLAAPTFSPAGGSYPSAQSVTVRTSSTGASVYCSTTSSYPSRSGGLRYGGPVSVASTSTLCCMASSNDGRRQSETKCATYTIGTALPDCATAPLRGAPGVVYYYCDCQAGADPSCAGHEGNDANPGTSPSAPRRTWGSAISQFSTMNAGDTVALCRGGAFTVSGASGVFNSRCTAQSTCDFRDYYPSWGGTARPIANIAGTNTFNVNGGAGYRWWNLDLRNSNGTTGVFYWTYGQTTNVDICNVAMDGGDAGIVEQATNRFWTIRSSQFTNQYNQGILAGSVGLRITGNYFRDAGTRTSQHHSIYVQDGTHEPSDGVHNADAFGHAGGYWDEQVTGNEIHVGVSRGCLGTVLVTHGRHWDMLIQNNLIYIHGPSSTAGCYAIGVGGGTGAGDYVLATWMERIRVDRNLIYGDGTGEGIRMSTCGSCEVTNNSVVLTARYSGYAWRGIAFGDDACRAGMSPPEQCNDAGQVRHNSIYIGDTGSQGAIWIQNEGSSFVVENNAAWGATTGWNNGTSCYAIGRPTARPVSNNYCAGPSTSVATVFRDWNANDMRPVSPGPLIGYGSSTNYAPSALDWPWSAAGTGVARTPPIDAGAFVH